MWLEFKLIYFKATIKHRYHRDFSCICDEKKIQFIMVGYIESALIHKSSTIYLQLGFFYNISRLLTKLILKECGILKDKQ